MPVLARNVRILGVWESARTRPLIVGLILRAGCGTSQWWNESARRTKGTGEAGEVERDASGCLLAATFPSVVN
jgi:hypothetical protein